MQFTNATGMIHCSARYTLRFVNIIDFFFKNGIDEVGAHAVQYSWRHNFAQTRVQNSGLTDNTVLNVCQNLRINLL